MNEKNFVSVFVTEFPEFQSFLEEHLEYNEELFPHIFFGDFNEHLIKLLEEEKDDTKLSSIFSFFERMATNDDIYVQEVLSVTILERIGDNPKILKAAHKYMGPNTRKASSEIEKGWGRSLN